MPARAMRMPITKVRDRLCTLLGGRGEPEAVEITRRDRTIGRLVVGTRAVSRAQARIAGQNPSPRKTLRGTVAIHGDIEAGLRKVRARLRRKPRRKGAAVRDGHARPLTP